MTKNGCIALLAIVISVLISAWWGWSLGFSTQGGLLDFQSVYFGSRTLFEHHNPYSVHDMEEVFQHGGSALSRLTLERHNHISLFVNTPATILFVAPFAFLPLLPAQVLWMIASAGGMALAAILIWNVAADYSPILAICLVVFLLLNCQEVFAAGNTAAIVVGLCVAGSWCLITNRLVPVGMLCIAVSLVMKPHDSGFIWLYFFLANSVNRKRALQTAGITLLITITSFVWVSQVAPNWLHDWQSNLANISSPGALNDPRPAAVMGTSPCNVISLQAVFSVFNQSASFFNIASYAVCGVPILLWAVSTARSQFSSKRAWFALAAITPFTLLVIYHRVYDAKLLLLTVPACAMLWRQRDATARFAVVITSVALVLNADIPLAALNNLTDRINLTTATLGEKLLTVILARPSQEILFVMGIFYLWVYLRSPLAQEHSSRQDAPKGELEPSHSLDNA